MSNQKTIDLRSDTVTLPCDAMKQTMFQAELGDDVIDIDPTIQKLQETAAKVLGKEASIFMPSGTMTNQIGIRIHCRPGDEIICEEGCHIFNYEQAGFAQLSGVVARPVAGKNYRLCLADIQDKIRAKNEHMARTRLLCLENTHNRGGGSILPIEDVREMTKWATANGLATHLDGARLFNAVVASGISAKEWSKNFDTVSICFSKGLGAPVGSILAGSKEDIAIARRHRKLFGGGIRQGGILAAAALYGLENNVERLAEDHQNAQRIAEAINETDFLHLEPEKVETNIIIFRVELPGVSAQDFVDRLEKQGVRTLAFGPNHVRMVTHLGVNEIGEIDWNELFKQVGSHVKIG